MKYFPIKDLKRADYNPRVMPEAEMQSLMLSIKTHGFVEPIVINISKERYGVIVGGHQRLTAVEKLLAKGFEPEGIRRMVQEAYQWEMPVFEVDLTEEAEKQLNIALNKIHGKFEENKLYDLILEMKDSPTLSSTGFDENDVAMILDRGGENALHTETSKEQCPRCMELKLQVIGHAKRSGHPIHFQENTDL